MRLSQGLRLGNGHTNRRVQPKWAQGKRALVEPERVLSLEELAQRLCRYYGCERLEPLAQKLG